MKFKKIIIFFVLLLLPAAGALASDLAGIVDDIPVVTIGDLIENSAKYEGRRVILQGEVIGDIMPRGKFAWINVQDQYSQIGVWIPLALTKQIAIKGSYRYKGDRVEILGVFKHADEEFGGEFCIRAIDLKIIQKGFASPHQQSSTKIHIMWCLFGFTVCLLLIRLLVPRGTKKKAGNNHVGF